MITKRLFPVLETSEEEKERLSEVNKAIDDLFEEGRIEEAEKLRGNSIRRLTLLYGPWKCNFRCPQYCYTKGTGDGVLSSEHTKEAIEQAREMGANVTYWPGEGELTLLEDFWDIMNYQAGEGLPAVVFTNGSIFHDDRMSNDILGVDSDELIEQLKSRYPKLHLYIKFWNSDQGKAAEMVGVDPKNYPYETIQGRSVPLALAKLYEGIDRERLGFEVVVSRENYDDVIENILPIIDDLGISGFVDPVIFSGNAQGRQHELSLTPEQHQRLAGIFASGGDYCEKRQSTELIVKGSKLTPGIAIPPRAEDTILDESGEVRDVFPIYHNMYFRGIRRRSDECGGCLCRAYWEGQRPDLAQIRT